MELSQGQVDVEKGSFAFLLGHAGGVFSDVSVDALDALGPLRADGRVYPRIAQAGGCAGMAAGHLVGVVQGCLRVQPLLGLRFRFVWRQVFILGLQLVGFSAKGKRPRQFLGGISLGGAAVAGQGGFG